MSRTAWIAVLAVVVAGVAVVAVVATRDDTPSKAQAVSNLCTSINELESSITALTSIQPTITSRDQIRSQVTAIQDNWNQVKSDAQAVKSASTGQLETAWSNFQSSVKNVTSAPSVSEAVNSVKQSGQALVSTAKSTASQLNCP